MLIGEKRLVGEIQYKPMIEFIHVCKDYGDVHALKNVNIKIAAGEFICLVGPSGAGKSTLVRLLIREEKPSSGKIFVAKRNVVRLKAKELPFYRRRIGTVFQDYKLLPQKTVQENIAFALEVCAIDEQEIKKRVNKIMKLIGLSNKADVYPQTLSGGEKQRVAIARALVHSPKVLIADEPTGNLDPVNAWEIIELLKKINKVGTLVILATHNKTIVDKLRQRVVLLKGGRVISDQRIGKYIM